MNSTEKLYEIIKDMTEPTVTELLDFAEFLKGKKQSKKVMNDEMLSALKGGVENSHALAGDPMKIQEMLRNEWN